MQFADASSIPFRDPGTKHREGNIQFKYLLTGEAGSPQNYELSQVRTADRFYGPPHRHNFDQIRYVIKGRFGQPGKLEMQEGEVGYYPEGTPYQIDSGDSDILILQFGGASGNGFTHYEELRRNYPILAGKGEFTDGVFRWHEPPPGTAKQQDGYEALWELINGKPLVYPRQRYRHPVLMNPEGFAWMPAKDKGVFSRELGRFNERGTGVTQVRISAGTGTRLASPDTIRLLYVLEGTGRIGERELAPGCAFEIRRGESFPATATQDLLLLDFQLPRFDNAPAGTTHAGNAQASSSSTRPEALA